MGRHAKPGHLYVLCHPAWSCIGICKIGLTSRHPARRLAELTSSSGLIAPGRVHFSIAVGNMEAAENEVKRLLARQRVRKQRELFRVTPEAAQRAVEAAAATAGTVGPVWNQPPRSVRARPPLPVFHVKHRRGWRWHGEGARALFALAALAVILGLGALW